MATEYDVEKRVKAGLRAFSLGLHDFNVIVALASPPPSFLLLFI